MITASLLLMVIALLLAIGSLFDRRYPLINVAVVLLLIALLVGGCGGTGRVLVG